MSKFRKSSANFNLFSVVFGLEWKLGGKYFMDVPMNVTEATNNNWTKTNRPEGPLEDLVMYCPVEYHLCALFDDTENIAGLQIAVRLTYVSLQ